jgi:hypothetical protein
VLFLKGNEERDNEINRDEVFSVNGRDSS